MDFFPWQSHHLVGSDRLIVFVEPGDPTVEDGAFNWDRLRTMDFTKGAGPFGSRIRLRSHQEFSPADL